MPHRDPETGQFVPGSGGGSSGGLDYSDFEYEHVRILVEPSGATTGDAGAQILFSQDAMEDRGGLENDELAELVAVWAHVELVDQLTQDDQSDITGRTSFGVNLAEAEQNLSPTATGTLETNAAGFDDDDGGSRFELSSGVEPGLLYQVVQQVTSAEGDATNGIGTATQAATAIVDRQYRPLLGRGPVVDPTDQLDWWFFVDHDVLGQGTAIRVSQWMVWDIATVENQRARFSLP